MPIKIIALWATLIQLARALGQARLRGIPEEIAHAEAEYKSYADICLMADEIH